MSSETVFLWLVLVVAAGTYLTRYLPFYIARKVAVSKWRSGRFKAYLEHVSPAIIAALLVVSLDSAMISTARSLLSTLVGLVITAGSWWRWRNTGLSVFAGIVGYAALLLVLR
ncbi:MAG TPA: AzlD domain-containing protein [Gammaproteobacteria bacterium]|nr:AzlD domain-containing protein [Gammaproteobacteria bacterium]